MQDLRDPERMNEVPARLLRAGLAERLFRERVRRGYDPFADPKVKQRLNAPCLEPDAEKLGADLTSFFESLSTEPLEEGVEKMLTVLRAEISRYQRGELTFRQWLSQPVTQLLLVLNSSLDFQHTHVQPQAITNVRFFEGFDPKRDPGLARVQKPPRTRTRDAHVRVGIPSPRPELARKLSAPSRTGRILQPHRNSRSDRPDLRPPGRVPGAFSIALPSTVGPTPSRVYWVAGVFG